MEATFINSQLSLEDGREKKRTNSSQRKPSLEGNSLKQLEIIPLKDGIK